VLTVWGEKNVAALIYLSMTRQINRLKELIFVFPEEEDPEEEEISVSSMNKINYQNALIICFEYKFVFIGAAIRMFY